MTVESTLDRQSRAGREARSDAAQPELGLFEDVATLWYDVLDGREWDRLTAGFDGVCQEQLCVFSEARWPGVTIDPMVFRSGDRVVGGCLVMYRALPLRLGGLAVVKWGPMLAEAGAPSAERDMAAMVETLIERYTVDMGLMLSVLPRAVPMPQNPLQSRLAARGFSSGVRLPFPNRYFVRIEADDEAQRASFAQKWRYHLKQAEKQELQFQRYPASALPIFQGLYDAMIDRKRFPDYSAVHTLPVLMATNINAVRPELFLIHNDGAPVAGAIIFTAGDTAVYLYGATNDKALPLNAGFFLHERIIAWLRENTRVKWYDLGGTDGFDGLHRFKSGMVGKTGVISQVPPAMYYAHHAWPRMVGEAAFWARDARTRVRQVFDRRRAHHH